MNIITLILIPCIKIETYFLYLIVVKTNLLAQTYVDSGLENDKCLCCDHCFNVATFIHKWYCIEQLGQKVVIANQEEYGSMTQLEKTKIAFI